MSRILITGSTGFIGKPFVSHLRSLGYDCRVAVSNIDKSNPIEQILMPRLAKDLDWGVALDGCDTVIHLAARVHQLNEDPKTAQKAYNEVNYLATETLAKQAAQAGVKRFIFLSTIKVLGEHSSTAWTPDTPPNPSCPYGKSKLKAELAIQAVGSSSAMEWVIIRPPLVYGAGAKGNFPKVVRLIETCPVLPLGGIKNTRSMVSVENLCDLIETCIHHPKAANQLFHIQDNNACSTTDFFKDCAEGLSRRIFLLKVPKSFVTLAAKLFKKQSVIDRLWGSLCVDDECTRQKLNWHEPIPYKSALKSALQAIKAN
jgi:UDP-glucose 4-epimerase